MSTIENPSLAQLNASPEASARTLTLGLYQVAFKRIITAGVWRVGTASLGRPVGCVLKASDAYGRPGGSFLPLAVLIGLSGKWYAAGVFREGGGFADLFASAK